MFFLYISPANSSYTIPTGVDQQIFSKVEDDVTKYNANGDILIMGDLNTHINCNERDFIKNDLDDVLDSFLPVNYIADNVHMLCNTRVHQNTNCYGKCVLELCNDSQLRILNGRTLVDTAGKATFFSQNGVSIDDYCICSSSFLSNIVNFQVDEFIPNVSDHCPITVMFCHNILNIFHPVHLGPCHLI
jgi:exonuclease III